MKREIKFRAWDDFNECYYQSDEGRFPHLAAFFLHVKLCDDGGNGIIIEQFTGLKDKNGIEIYEGDIVTYYGITSNGNSVVRKIIYNEERCQFMAEIYQIECPSISKCVVIGNIHNNPELLK